ncbi:MAG TPA: GNAT family N-acetyltransferase [Nitrososphaeraceae archaeon]
MVIIRPMEYEDIEKGFLEVLENLVPADIDKKQAKEILQNIKSNPLHKIFVAEEEQQGCKKIVGTTTLFVEPKFINKGMRVGYIEDVSVKKGHEGLGIGSKLVTYATKHGISVERCEKILLYCSEKNRPLYDKLGYKLAADTFVMKFET